MYSIRIKRPTAIIPHPNRLEVRVVVEEPSRVDYLNWRQMVQENQRVEAAVNSITGEPIYDSAGVLETITRPANLPSEKLVEYLERQVMSVVGIKEQDATKTEILTAFLEREWDCIDIEKEFTTEKVEGGKKVLVKEKRKVNQSFTIYLLDKVHEEATFTRLDPTSSAEPSSSG